MIDLRDPCNTDTHTTIVASNPTDTTYTLTDESKDDFVFPEFTVTPSFCTLDYSCSATPFLSGESAITISDRTSSFYYAGTLDVLLEK